MLRIPSSIYCTNNINAAYPVCKLILFIYNINVAYSESKGVKLEGKVVTGFVSML